MHLVTKNEFEDHGTLTDFILRPFFPIQLRLDIIFIRADWLIINVSALKIESEENIVG